MKKVGIFRGLITEADNVTISPTFAAVYFAVYIILPLVLLTLAGLAVVDVVVNQHEANVGGVGGGIAAVIAAVGAFVTGMAVVLSQDKKPDAPVTTTTTTSTSTMPASAPLQVDVVNLPAQPPPAEAAGYEDGPKRARKTKA